MSSLVISPANHPGLRSFRWTGVLALPVPVETAGLVLHDGDAFRVWINRPGEGSAIQVAASQTSGTRELESVPFLTAAGAVCRSEFLLTGADAAGRPVAASISAAGKVGWRCAVPSPNPFRWPAPGCGSRPLVVWQDEPQVVRAGEVGPAGVHPWRPFAVGGPPLSIAVAADSVWCIWSGSDGVVAAESQAGGMRQFPVASVYSSEVAIGTCGSAVCAVWLEDKTALLTTVAPGSGLPLEREPLDLGAARGGSLSMVPAAFPLVLGRTARAIEGEPFESRSVLTAPGMAPVELIGLLHGVACNGNVVALLGGTGLYFLSAGSAG